MASEETDFPEPDSPTSATASPCSTWNEIERVASTVRSPSVKRTLSSSTESSGAVSEDALDGPEATAYT